MYGPKKSQKRHNMPSLVIRCPICGGSCAVHGKFIQCSVHGFFDSEDLLTVVEY